MSTGRSNIFIELIFIILCKSYIRFVCVRAWTERVIGEINSCQQLQTKRKKKNKVKISIRLWCTSALQLELFFRSICNRPVFNCAISTNSKDTWSRKQFSIAYRLVQTKLQLKSIILWAVTYFWLKSNAVKMWCVKWNKLKCKLTLAVSTLFVCCYCCCMIFI